MDGPTFKLILVGDGGVGKTTFVNRMKTGEFEKKYAATLGVGVYHIDFETEEVGTKKKSTIRFNCWDTAGQERFGGLRDGYYIMGKACMVFYSLDEPLSQYNALNWARSVKKVCGDIPFVFVGAKSDMNQVHIPCDTSEFNNAPSFAVSAKSYSNMEDPFLYLANCLLPEVVELADWEESDEE